MITPGAEVDKRALWALTGYKPHAGCAGCSRCPKGTGSQQDYHNSTARFKVAASGRRYGKSRMAAADKEHHLFRVHSDGSPTKGWIVGPTYKLGAKEFEYMYNDIVTRACKGLPGIRHAFNVRTGEMYIIMPWGSSVEVRSADHADGLVSEGLDWVIVTEAAKQDRKVWEKYLRPALADFRGEADFPSTPEGSNWFKEVHDKGIPGSPDATANGGQWESWNFPSWCNPVVYPLGYDDPEIASMMLSRERDIEDPWFDQEIAAEFTSFVGKVYGEFSERIHVRSRPYEPGAPNYLAQDYGFTNPFVALDVQVLPGDRIHIWREYYVSGLPVHQHAEALNKRGQPTGYAIRCGFGDPADPGAIVTMSQLVAPTIGDPRMKSDISWIDGVREIKKFLALREVRDLDSGIITLEPGLTVDPSCVNTIWEFDNYRTQQPRKEEENKKDKPKKWADHALDALRYAVVSLYLLGAQYHLSEFVSVPVAEGGKSLSRAGAFSDSPAGTESYFSTSGDSLFTLGHKDF